MNVADVCQICFESFNENDNEDLRCDDKVVLPCHETHVFGRKCIAQWFDRSKKCPICRSEVPSFILESMPLTRSLHERVIRKVSQIATDVFICAASSALTAATFIGAAGIINLAIGLAETDDVESSLATGVSTAIATGSVFGAANSLADLKLFAFTGAVIGFAGCPIAFASNGYLSASHFAGFATGAYVGGIWSYISSTHLDP
ncbi:RING finger domain-containing protein [Endozoicomonas acroporae]|uniref:RING finger domain-containing protein n=1 Tax=Endozoicomonas acroporae TaxID=1701104 RepID=UPI000C78FBE5|nr:RING finger domain-containing protein [Endozoicomonas acroporae]